MEQTKEQLLASQAKLQKQMSDLVDDYLANDRANTAKFMVKRTRLDVLMRGVKDAIAVHP